MVVADLADPASRDLLAGLALAGGKAYLPLLTAPVSSSTHVLEVYTPDRPDPLVLFAEPLGGPTPVGFPVKLRPYDAREGAAGGSGEMRSRVPTSVTLTERHTADLGRHGQAAQVEPEALVGRAIAGGKLRIQGVIGSGGVGAVYRATHRDLQIPVAVKVLHHRFQQDLEFCNRFHSEALAASGLDHPNLVRVLDFGQESDGLLYLAMEHLDGVPLGELLRAGLPISPKRIVSIMMQVCAGLAHAHTRGIVHRDVKPDNVMLVQNDDDDGRPNEIVKVCDFGIALAQSDGASTAVVGTPDYMSPEQCRGEPLDGRSDVYSCGIMLYELVTGQMPFDAQDALGLLNRHMFVEPDPPSSRARDLDPRLDALIMKALAKDPNARQTSMRELRHELRALLQDAGESVPPTSSLAPAPRSQVLPAVGGFRPEADTSPEWLERGGGSFRHDSGGEATAVDVGATLLAGELAQRPAPWLSAFAEAARDDQLTILAHRLAAAIPVLAGEGNVKALFAVRCTLDELAADDRQPAWRSEKASALLHLLAEPRLLAALAEAVLSSDHPPRETTELLMREGTPASYALYSARLKLHEVEGARRRFVLLVRELGAAALPMIRAGLSRLEGSRTRPVAATLAYDLLRASPRQRDDEAGEVTALYLEGSPAQLVRVAVEALAAFWEQRATPLLVGLLGSEDDGVRIACIDGLRQLRAVDEYAVTRIHFAARTSTSNDVRIAARSALLETTGNGRVVATRALEQLESDERPVSR